MATVTLDQALANARQLLNGQPAAALAQARAVIDEVPSSAAAHRLAAHALRALGREDEAQTASLAAVSAAIHDEAMVAAALALSENRLPDAEGALRGRLREDATDVAAIRMLAEVAGRLGRYEDAEKLLSRALQLAPKPPKRLTPCWRAIPTTPRTRTFAPPRSAASAAMTRRSRSTSN